MDLLACFLRGKCLHNRLFEGPLPVEKRVLALHAQLLLALLSGRVFEGRGRYRYARLAGDHLPRLLLRHLTDRAETLRPLRVAQYLGARTRMRVLLFRCRILGRRRLIIRLFLAFRADLLL